MEPLRFRATLADGRVLEGPVQGYGGKLGTGALHAGFSAARREALRRLAFAKRMLARGRALPMYEPEPGCVAIYPDYSAESDGEPVVVPVKGTAWHVVKPA